MCLVLDTRAFSNVFDENAKEHHRYVAVVDWISDGDGKIIYGGSKYKKEIRGSAFMRILAEFDRKGKLVRVSDSQVDRLSRELKKQVPERKFNDEHLVALVSITKCRVVCTDDKQAMEYLRKRELYPKGTKAPKIYQYKSHSHLCCNEHIVAACR